MSADLTWPKAVFFDWDGTLVETLSLLEGVHNETRSALGLEPKEQGWFTTYFGWEREALYRDIYGEQSEAAKAIFEKTLIARHLDLIEKTSGADELLSLLHNKSIPMGVITNKKRMFAEPEVAHFAWEHYFKTLVCAGEAEHDKPDAAPLFMAIENAGLQLNQQDIWLVGDTKADMQCAAAAGTKMIYLDHLGRDNDWAAAHPPDLQVKNCAELLRFLLQCPEN